MTSWRCGWRSWSWHGHWNTERWWVGNDWVENGTGSWRRSSRWAAFSCGRAGGLKTGCNQSSFGLECSKGNVDEATKNGDIAVVAEVIDDGTDSHVGDLLVRLCLTQLSSRAGGCDDASAGGKLDEMHGVEMDG